MENSFMRLTSSEQRALARLVKNQQHWRWWRFVVLACGLAVVASGFYLQRFLLEGLLDTTRRMSVTESPTGAEVFFASQYGGLLAVIQALFPALGATIIARVLASWSGDPLHVLLLRLVQDDPQIPQAGGKDTVA
jgi:hypothetical protein